MGSRQDVFNEPQHVSAVACQQPSSQEGEGTGSGTGILSSENPGNAISDTTNEKADMI